MCVRVRACVLYDFVIAATAPGQSGSVGGRGFLGELLWRRLGQNDTLHRLAPPITTR